MLLQVFDLGPNWDGHTGDLDRVFWGRPSEAIVKIYGLRFLSHYFQTKASDVSHDTCRGLVGPAPGFPPVPPGRENYRVRIADNLADGGKENPIEHSVVPEVPQEGAQH